MKIHSLLSFSTPSIDFCCGKYLTFVQIYELQLGLFNIIFQTSEDHQLFSFQKYLVFSTLIFQGIHACLLNVWFGYIHFYCKQLTAHMALEHLPGRSVEQQHIDVSTNKQVITEGINKGACIKLLNHLYVCIYPPYKILFRLSNITIKNTEIK